MAVGGTERAGMRSENMVEKGAKAAGIVSDRGVKPGILTSEFISSMIAAIGVLVAAAVADNFHADEAWPLIALLSIGYMISRGLAKLGAGWRREYR